MVVTRDPGREQDEHKGHKATRLSAWKRERFVGQTVSNKRRTLQGRQGNRYLNRLGEPILLGQKDKWDAFRKFLV